MRAFQDAECSKATENWRLKNEELKKELQVLTQSDFTIAELHEARSKLKELEEVIFNLGFEYKYTENFTLRAGFIYDLEGDLKNPTLGAGIDFINYGFDFGYTLGDTGSPRSNTMFFSLKIDV